MGGSKESSSTFADEVQHLLELLKEGASYLLHIYLFFISKSVPLEFLEKLLENHKGKSSYNFSVDGKTYLYRITHCIFKVEKHIIGMALEYLYSVIPLPFMKSLYENFCVNNDLDCADVKLQKCKRALENSNKNNSNKKKGSSKDDQNKDDNNDDEGETDQPVAKKLYPSLEDQNQTTDKTPAIKPFTFEIPPIKPLPPPPKIELIPFQPLPPLPKVELPPINPLPPLPKIELPPIKPLPPLPKIEIPPIKPLFPPPKFELPKIQPLPPLPKIELPPIKPLPPLPKIEFPPIKPLPPLPKFEIPPFKPLPNPFNQPSSSSK